MSKWLWQDDEIEELFAAAEFYEKQDLPSGMITPYIMEEEEEEEEEEEGTEIQEAVEMLFQLVEQVDPPSDVIIWQHEYFAQPA